MIFKSCLLSTASSAAILLTMLFQTTDDQANDVEYRATTEATAGTKLQENGATGDASCDDKWEKFLPFNMVEHGEIECIEIAFFRKGIELYDLRYGLASRFRLPPTKVVVADVKDVSIASRCFDGDSCLRRIYLKGVFAGTSIIRLGRIVFKTSKGDFTIWITDLGFSVTEAAGFEDLFYAPAGAQVLCMHCYRVQGVLLPDQLMDALTGADFINQTRQSFHMSTWSIADKP